MILHDFSDVAVVYNSLRRGNIITDDELKRTIPVLQAMFEFMSGITDNRFFFFQKDIREALDELLDFQEQRKR